MEHSFVCYFETARQPKRQRDLTPLELAALRYLSHGLTYGMIASERGVTEATVKRQVWCARHKLAAKNTTHAVALAIRLGLIA